jgi:hypothetical protein
MAVFFFFKLCSAFLETQFLNHQKTVINTEMMKDDNHCKLNDQF